MSLHVRKMGSGAVVTFKVLAFAELWRQLRSRPHGIRRTEDGGEN
jgi:hypothetical protein